MVGSVNAVEYVRIVARVHPAQDYHRVGILIILFVTRVTNKGTRVFLVHFAEKHIEQLHIEKWYSAVRVKNLFMVPVIQRLTH